jgi:hypothetical protein
MYTAIVNFLNIPAVTFGLAGIFALLVGFILAAGIIGIREAILNARYDREEAIISERVNREYDARMAAWLNDRTETVTYPANNR